MTPPLTERALADAAEHATDPATIARIVDIAVGWSLVPSEMASSVQLFAALFRGGIDRVTPTQVAEILPRLVELRRRGGHYRNLTFELTGPIIDLLIERPILQRAALEHTDLARHPEYRQIIDGTVRKHRHTSRNHHGIEVLRTALCAHIDYVTDDNRLLLFRHLDDLGGIPPGYAAAIPAETVAATGPWKSWTFQLIGAATGADWVDWGTVTDAVADPHRTATALQILADAPDDIRARIDDVLPHDWLTRCSTAAHALSKRFRVPGPVQAELDEARTTSDQERLATLAEYPEHSAITAALISNPAVNGQRLINLTSSYGYGHLPGAEIDCAKSCLPLYELRSWDRRWAATLARACPTLAARFDPTGSFAIHALSSGAGADSGLSRAVPEDRLGEIAAPAVFAAARYDARIANLVGATVAGLDPTQIALCDQLAGTFAGTFNDLVAVVADAAET